MRGQIFVLYFPLNPSFSKPFSTHIFYQGGGGGGRSDPLLSQKRLTHELEILYVIKKSLWKSLKCKSCLHSVYLVTIATPQRRGAFSWKSLDFSRKYQLFKLLANYENSPSNSPIISHFKNIIFVWVESQILGRDRRKSRGKTRKKLSFFHGNHGQLFQFYPGRIEAPSLHVFDPNSLSFYVKWPRKCRKKQ